MKYIEPKPPSQREPAPAGKYRVRVVEWERGLSQGAKTSGMTAFYPVFAIEDASGEVDSRYFTLDEMLIDDSERGSDSSCAWKIFAFVKSAGYVLQKGEAFEFDQDRAKESGCRFINPLGLRLNVEIEVEGYQKKTDKPGEKTGRKNRVKRYLQDETPLPRVDGTNDELTQDEPF